jgi:hypothetical protein
MQNPIAKILQLIEQSLFLPAEKKEELSAAIRQNPSGDYAALFALLKKGEEKQVQALQEAYARDPDFFKKLENFKQKRLTFFRQTAELKEEISADQKLQTQLNKN